MPSVRGRVLNLGMRLTMRRSDWGGEAALVRRARRLFGMPPVLRALWSRGVEIRATTEPIAGEWVVPPDATGGALLFLHGGGFVAGSPQDHRPMTAGLARRTRLRVFAPEYRLAPEHRFPAAYDDAFAAYRWIVAQQADARHIVLAGDSAGGGLVLGTLVRARDAGLPLPARAVCFSPWADLSGSADSVRTMDGRCHMFRSGNIAAFAAVFLGDASPREPAASPLFADLGGLPPLLFQVGSTELLFDDARATHEKVLAAGGSSRLDVADDMTHGWHMLDGVVPEATAALDAAARFLSP